MKVLHIIPSLAKGGAERICLDIIRETKKRGHTVHLVVLSQINDYSSEYSDIKPIYINSKITPSILKKWKVDITEWTKLLVQLDPDIIHSHLFEAELISRYKIQTHIKYFTHCHDNMYQLANFSFISLFKKTALVSFYEKQFIIRRYNKCFNNFIAISTDTKRYFEMVLPNTLTKKITLLHNAIDFSAFNKYNNPRNLGLLHLVNVGSFTPKKNQRFLILVAEALIKMGIDVKLTLLGDGPERSILYDYVLKNGLENVIDMPGIVNNVPTYLKDANIYVHSATYEPFGLVLIEAMATGLPVVCLDGRGNRDLIVNGENGFLIESNRPEDFCSKLLTIFHDHLLYKKMSDHAHEFAETFDIKKYVDKLLSLYLN